MHRFSSSRWLVAGAAVFPTGAALAIAWLIYVKEAPTFQSYWSWPGTLGVTVAVVGFVMVVVGFVMPSPKKSKRGRRAMQKQSGGANSINLQSGRDIILRNKGE
jgi:hypothetical protein